MILNRRFAVVCLAVGVVTACTDSTEPLSRSATFTGELDGASWSANATAVMSGDTLSIYAGSPIDPRPFYDEELSVRIVPTGVGTYSLGPESVRFMEIVGGDVIGATYLPTLGSPGTLRLTVYNGVGGIVEGDIEFDAVTSSPYASHGTKASMRNGHFSAIVKAQLKS